MMKSKTAACGNIKWTRLLQVLSAACTYSFLLSSRAVSVYVPRWMLPVFAVAFLVFLATSVPPVDDPIVSSSTGKTKEKTRNRAPVTLRLCETREIPSDAMGVVLRYLDWSSTIALETTCHSWRRDKMRETRWRTHFRRTFRRDAFDRASKIYNGGKRHWRELFRSQLGVRRVVAQHRIWCMDNLDTLRQMCETRHRTVDLHDCLRMFPNRPFQDRTRDDAPFVKGKGTVYDERHLLREEIGTFHANVSIDAKGRTLLMACVRAGCNVDAIKLLIRKGANVRHRDASGNTVLHFCFEYGHLALASWLVRKFHADDSLTNVEDGSVYDGLCGGR